MITAPLPRASPSRSGRLSMIIPRYYGLTTRKMVPIPRRASSFLVVIFIHVNRKEEEEEGETEQFTIGCNILHRLQVYHLT